MERASERALLLLCLRPSCLSCAVLPFRSVRCCHKYNHHRYWLTRRGDACLFISSSSTRLLCPYRPVSSARSRHRRRLEEQRPKMVMMGQLGRLVDGIKSRLRAGGGGKRGGGGSGRKASSSPTAAGYGKVEKTDSMRVEIRSRQARKLIAKNLDAADSIGRAARARNNKRFFLAF